MVLENNEGSTGVDVTAEQAMKCREHGVDPYPPFLSLKFGVSATALAGVYPLNGLRHVDEAGTSGWYVWAGEALSQDPSYFMPLHGAHIAETRPEISQFLALPPGWRFLIAPDYEDVWFDQSLLR